MTVRRQTGLVPRLRERTVYYNTELNDCSIIIYLKKAEICVVKNFHINVKVMSYIDIRLKEIRITVGSSIAAMVTDL